MKNIYLSLVLSFISSLGFSQTTGNTGYNMLTTNNEIIIADKILYSTDSNLFFTVSGSETCYKIPLSLLLKSDSFGKQLPSTEFTYYLSKFVSKSQTGITLQIIGTVGSIILPFAGAPIALFAVPSVVGVAGWIIWASSYKALKEFATIDRAIEWGSVKKESGNSDEISQVAISPNNDAMSSKEILLNLNDGLLNKKINISEYDNSYNEPTIGDYAIFQTETSEKQVGRILSFDCNNKNCDCLVEVLSQSGEMITLTIKRKQLLGIAYM
jgi:hypothetical protein